MRPDVELENVPCPLCGESRCSDSLRAPSFDLKEEFELQRCAGCRAWYLSPRPIERDIGAYYPQEYHVGVSNSADSDRFSARLRRPLQRAVLQHRWGWPRSIPRPLAALVAWIYEPFLGRAVPYVDSGRVLDIGCGTGEFLAWLLSLAPDWSVEGIDISETACELAREEGLRCSVGTLFDQDFADGSFDLVTMWNVLEHLHDPRAVLSEVARILTPGGHLALVVPTMSSAQARRFGGRWWVLQLPQHLVFFDHATLREHLEAVGFEVQKLTPRQLTYSRHSVRRAALIEGREVSSMRVRIESLLDLFRRGDVLVAVAKRLPI